MSRLPVPGADDNIWGGILNDFLDVEHNTDGTQKTLAVTKGGTGAVDAATARTNLGAASAASLATKADDSAVVHNAGAENIAGVKTFSSAPVVPTPTSSTEVANKSYVDGVAGSGSTPDADAITKGKLQLAGDLGGTAASPTVPGLATKVGSVTAADATITIGGTSTAPTVGVGTIPESKVTNLTTDLAAKATDSTVVHNTGAESIAGIKTFTSAPVVPAGAFPESAVTNLTTDLAAKATDSAVVHNTGAESIAGVKTFTSAPVVPSSSFPESAVTNLTTDLSAKATDTLVVHLAGTETVTGSKNFTGGITKSGNAVVDTTDARLNDDMVFSKSGTLTVSTGVERWLQGGAVTILDVRAAVGTAPTGASIIMDINKNGTTIFTTQANRPTIAISANATASAAVPDVTSLASGDYVTVDIDQVGSTVAGADLTVFIRYHR